MDGRPTECAAHFLGEGRRGQRHSDKVQVMSLHTVSPPRLRVAITGSWAVFIGATPPLSVTGVTATSEGRVKKHYAFQPVSTGRVSFCLTL